MKHRLFRLLLLFAALLLLSPAQAALVEVGGQAKIQLWGVDSARRAALKDAVRRASELGRVGGIGKIMRAANGERTPPREGSGYRILSQEIDDGWLYLVVELEVVNGQACEQVSPLRKKVAVTAFPMLRTAQARGREVNFLEQGVARELGRRLSRHALYRVAEVTPLHPFSGLDDGQALDGTAIDPADIVAIGEQHGAQAVVTGIIRDVGVRHGNHYAFATPLGEKPFTTDDDERAFELELLIYDAVSGGLLASRSFRDQVDGEVGLDVDAPSGLSRSFLTSDYGRVIDRLLRHAALTVDFSLACQPFMARVVRVEGDDVYLDAGSTANIAKGSRFEALITTRDAFRAGGGTSTLVETPAGILTVVKNAAGFSIGRLKVDNALRPGDIVREP